MKGITLRTAPPSASSRIAVVAATAMTALTLAGCSGPADDGKTVITLAGPNQWTTDAGSFGPAWDELVAAFEAENPDIRVKTTVLPIASFSDTLSTQLTAGTAPELIFNQVPHTPDQIHSLNEYLEQPNPFVDGNTRWLDAFDRDVFGDDRRNALGNFEYVPFNFVVAGMFYNVDIFDEVGIAAAPETYGELLDACRVLNDAGYSPLAMDSGPLGPGWTGEVITSMLMEQYDEEWNVYAPDGEPGTSSTVSQKSLVRAVLTGELNTRLPEYVEAMKIFKQVFDECATPNWSGVSAGATFVGAQEFLRGNAAMAWGTNFAVGNFDDVDWDWSSMPFPTITKADSPVATDVPARFGVAAGGTSYMIPSTVEGDKLDAAVTFLQFVTSPERNGDWVRDTGSIPSTVGSDSNVSPQIAPIATGEWAVAPPVRLSGMAPRDLQGQVGSGGGYLLGTRGLEETLDETQDVWNAWAREVVADGGWTEDWAQE